jgi:transcriptional regulator with XRE-family HTH domain
VLKSIQAWQLDKESRVMVMKKKRNRDSVALTELGVLHFRNQMKRNGLTQDSLAKEVFLSISTIKRLLRKQNIDQSSFSALIEYLELEIQDSHIVRRNIITPFFNGTLILVHFGFIMTGTFTEDKRHQIERTLRHLQCVMIDTEVIWGEDNGSIVVSGRFSTENEKHIKMTIKLLEKQLDSCHITW